MTQPNQVPDGREAMPDQLRGIALLGIIIQPFVQPTVRSPLVRDAVKSCWSRNAGSVSKLLEVEFGHADPLEPFADVEVASGVHRQAVGAVQAAGFQDGHWTDRPVG